jgi:VWFA-related protein
MTVRDQAVTFSTGVNMVSVPVVVRDNKGRAVGNLKQEDFQLFDRGKLQAISKFVVEKSAGKDAIAATEPTPVATLEVTQPTTATSAPERFIAYLFDDTHVQTNDLLMARDAADRHIKQSLGPKVRAAIYTTSGLTMLDFTDDKDKLHQTLFSLRPHPLADSVASRDCPDLTYFWADRIRNQNDEEALSWAVVLAQGCAAVDPSTAGKLVRAAVARVIARSEHSAMVPLETLRNAVGRMSVMPGQRTLVLASPGFLTLIGSRNEQSVIIDRAIRANVVINALDVRGLTLEYKDLSKPPLQVPPGANLAALFAYIEDLEHLEFNAREDVMAELAAGTGGTFYHNSNDLDAGFARVAGAPEYLYILGFSPKDLKMDGSLHNLKVSLVKNPEHLDLEARHSYTAPKKLDDPVEAAKQEIQDALFSREELRDIPLELHTEFFKTPQDRAKVRVITHIDLKPLKLRKTEGRNHDELTVTTGLFDNNGNYAAGIQRGVDLHLKDDTFDKWMANGILVPSNLEVMPGNYLVRVVVRDSEGHLLAARSGSVDIP